MIINPKKLKYKKVILILIKKETKKEEEKNQRKKIKAKIKIQNFMNQKRIKIHQKKI